MMIVTRQVKVDTNAMADEHSVAFYNITPKVLEQVPESYVANGTLTVFIPATTAAVGTIEFEEGLLNDFKTMWSRIIPKDIAYNHKFAFVENNAYSHVRASLMGASLVIPIVNGRLILGQFQQIVLVEFDNRARNRQIVLQFMGEKASGF
jgi:secondary thiamine-phosphate synthase enzyme